MFELFIEAFFEFLFDLLMQVLLEFGLHRSASFRRAPNPWLAAIAYALLGLLAGALSLLIVPTLFITHKPTRIVNLIVAPLLAGAAMSLIDAWRSGTRGERFIRFYLFALAVALVRFCFAK